MLSLALRRLGTSCFVLAGLFCLCPALRAAPKGGTISGTVRFTGTVPPTQSILVSDGTTIQHRDLVVNEKQRGLRSVLVWIEDAPAQPKLTDAKPVLVDQREWIFQPRVVAVQHGRPVQFDNNDACNHSVMSASVVRANQLNAVAGPGQPVVHTFEPQKEPIPIGCALHPWMRAWVLVVPHPFFAVTDAEGRYQISGVPAGRYTLVLLHPDTRLRERRTIIVEPEQQVDVSVEWKTLKEPAQR